MRSCCRWSIGTGSLLLLGWFCCAGCSNPSGPTASQPVVKSTGSGDGEPGHRHERGTMLIADAGKYHALLTAHLAKEGNELDVFFETADDKNPSPVAIPVESFTAQAQRGEGEGEPFELKFTCAPAEERPKGEKSGTCSHFVAKAPWMQPTDKLYVVARLTLDGKEVTIRWRDFIPKKYAHHEE